MTIELTKLTTPAGNLAGLMKVSGRVSGEDTEVVRRAASPGGEFHGKALLAVVAEGTEYPMEARKGFAAMGQAEPGVVGAPTAVVIKSASLRVVVNFIVKASNVARKTPTRVKFFSEMEPALAWLDAELAADAAAAAAPP